MEEERVCVKKLDHGPWHIRGVGVCNWSTVPEWPCSEATIRDCAGGEACEEFIRAAVALALAQTEGDDDGS